MNSLGTLLLVWLFFASSPAVDGWEIFARVKFNPTLIKELNEYFLVPFFDSRIKAYEGKEIILRGHFMPMELEDNNVIILSKFPYSQCFFCGGAGPESVAEIKLISRRPRLKADQVITVKGILSLNDLDVNHMNFILNNATLVTD